MTADLRLVPALAGGWLAGAAALLADPVRGAAVAAVLALATLVIGAGRRAPLLLAALAALAVTLSAAAQTAARGAGLTDGATVTLIGRVAEDGRATEIDSGFPARSVLAANGVIADGEASPTAARLVLLGDVEALRRDDVAVVTGRFAALPAGGATGLLVVEGEVTRTAPGGYRGALQDARARFRAVTDTLSPHGRGLVPGLATGDDSQLPDALAEAMRTASLTHLTAVSGSHVALVAGAVVVAASRVPRRARALAVLLALGLLVSLVGPEASVLRAAAMGCVAAVALARGRPPAAVPALAGGGTLLLVLDPWLALSLGFALSAVATAGLLLLAPALVEAWAPRGGRAAVLAAVLAVPVSAQLACGPLLLLVGGNVSAYGVLANLAVLPVVAPVTVLGLAGVAAVGWWPGLALVLARAADLFAGWIAWVAVTTSRWPHAAIPFPEGPGGVALLAAVHAGITVALLGIPRLARRTRAARGVRFVPLTAAGAAALALAVSLAARLLPGGGDWDVLLCDVGQGHALLVRTGPGRAALVDTGPPDGGVDRCLRGAGVRSLDLLVLTHAHADHVGGLDDVLAAVPVARVLTAPGPAPWVDEQLGALGLVREFALAGDSGRAGPVPYEVWWPLTGGRTEPARSAIGEDSESNDRSLVVAFATEGGTVLALGDLGADAQGGLARRVPGPVAVVVMAHHGSADQDPALAVALAPAVTLVGVGENEYGHPTTEALAIYAAHSGRIARTDVEGDIRVVFP